MLLLLSFPLCRGEAAQLSLRSMATFVIIFQCFLSLVLNSIHFSSSSAHLSIAAAVVLFFASCNLLVSLSQIFLVISRLSYVHVCMHVCACVQLCIVPSMCLYQGKQKMAHRGYSVNV